MAYVDSRLHTLLENNRKFAETSKKPFTMEQMRAVTIKAGGVFIIRLFPTLPNWPANPT